MSECAAKYYAAIARPWSSDAVGACVPKFPARPSQKVTGFARITVATGTTGYGFALFVPTLANDLVTVWATDATFAGTTSTFVATGTGTTSTVGVAGHHMGNLPYGYLSLKSDDLDNQNASGRIVAYAASIQYTGTTYNMGGQYRMFSDPAHNNLYGDSIGSRKECLIRRITPAKEWLALSATNEVELEYASGQYTPSQASGQTNTMGSCFPYSNSAYLDALSLSALYANGAAPMLFEFWSEPGNTFELEIVNHAEYVGVHTEGRNSPSHSDPKGLETVIAAAAAAPTILTQEVKATWSDAMARGLNDVARMTVPIATDALQRYMYGTSNRLAIRN